MSKHILIAEDDAHIREGITDLLEREGYQVTAAADGQEALELFPESNCDLLLLDIMMPRLSGYDLCRQIRKQDDRVPIIMLTAKSEEVDKVVGLELGADDYITKPFGVHELLARVAAVLRRAAQPAAQQSNRKEHFPFGEATIDRLTYIAELNGEKHPLSSRELTIIDTFCDHPGEVLSRDQLLNAAWGINYYGTTRTLDQHIAQLRKKIETEPATPTTIITVHGIGYRYSSTKDYS